VRCRLLALLLLVPAATAGAGTAADDARTLKRVRVLSGPHRGVFGLALSPDGKLLAAAQWDHHARIWDVGTGREVARLRHEERDLACVAFTPDGKQLLVGARSPAGGLVVVWDVAARKVVRRLHCHEGHVGCLGFSPDGKLLATHGLRGARLWTWPALEPRARVDVDGHRGGCAFSPDGTLLAFGGEGDKGGVVHLVDTATGERAGELSGHPTAVWTVAFSPDGETIAAGGLGPKITLWAHRTRKHLATLEKHDNDVIVLRYTPDGRFLFSGSHDGTWTLWDAKRKKPLRRERRGGDVLDAAIDAASRRIYHSCADVEVWEFPADGE